MLQGGYTVVSPRGLEGKRDSAALNSKQHHALVKTSSLNDVCEERSVNVTGMGLLPEDGAPGLWGRPLQGQRLTSYAGEAVCCPGVCGNARGEAHRPLCEKQVRMECQHRPRTLRSMEKDTFAKLSLETSSEHHSLTSEKQL